MPTPDNDDHEKTDTVADAPSTAALPTTADQAGLPPATVEPAVATPAAAPPAVSRESVARACVRPGKRRKIVCGVVVPDPEDEGHEG
jgi:hypothetical protein